MIEENKNNWKYYQAAHGGRQQYELKKIWSKNAKGDKRNHDKGVVNESVSDTNSNGAAFVNGQWMCLFKKKL